MFRLIMFILSKLRKLWKQVDISQIFEKNIKEKNTIRYSTYVNIYQRKLLPNNY